MGKKQNIGAKALKLRAKLIKANKELEAAQDEMVAFIKPLTDVEQISVFSQPGDGFVVCDANANNASLSSCLAVIIEKGWLSVHDYESLTI